jgi:thiosulfate dehydrogenase [quinone] large subunit
MTTLDNNSRHNGQTPNMGLRSHIRISRVKLLPLNDDGYKILQYTESSIYTKDATLVKSNTTEQQKHSPFFFGWTLLPMRLFLGITFAYAGIQKLTDPQFFDPSAPSSIGHQLVAFAHGSPLHDLLIQVAAPHAVLFGYAIAFGEIAIGLGTLFGLLFRPAAFFGLILSLVFFLSASWLVTPYFYGADIVFAFCWLIMLLHGPVATGYPTLDAWLMTRLIPPRRGKPAATARGLPGQTTGWVSFVRTLLIGSPYRSQAVMPVGEGYVMSDVRPPVRQRKREARRNFLLGAITGVSGAVGLGIIGFIINARLSNGKSTATQSTTQNANRPTASGTSTATSSIIAQVSAIAKNESATFTIPSTGHHGILIHLPNDQFVAYDATCTHAGCPVNYDPAGQHLVCPCHGATYDPAQQAVVLSGPTKFPLAAVPIGVDNATGTIRLRS